MYMKFRGRFCCRSYNFCVDGHFRLLAKYLSICREVLQITSFESAEPAVSDKVKIERSSLTKSRLHLAGYADWRPQAERCTCNYRL
jgi:hypothetical protein